MCSQAPQAIINYSGISLIWTHGTTAEGPEYRGVCSSEASGIFQVGVVMHTHAVERYADVYISGRRSNAYSCC